MPVTKQAVLEAARRHAAARWPDYETRLAVWLDVNATARAGGTQYRELRDAFNAATTFLQAAEEHNRFAKAMRPHWASLSAILEAIDRDVAPLPRSDAQAPWLASMHRVFGESLTPRDLACLRVLLGRVDLDRTILASCETPEEALGRVQKQIRDGKRSSRAK